MAVVPSTCGLMVVVDLPYDVARARVEEALREQGFGVLTEIDVKATMKKKLDADFRRYVILGACNPHLAHRALSLDLEVGLLLPCNVVVHEADDGRTVVSCIEPRAMMGVVDRAGLEAVAEEARAGLVRALEALEAGAATGAAGE